MQFYAGSWYCQLINDWNCIFRHNADCKSFTWSPSDKICHLGGYIAYLDIGTKSVFAKIEGLLRDRASSESSLEIFSGYWT